MPPARSNYGPLAAVYRPLGDTVQRLLPDLVGYWCDAYRSTTQNAIISEVRLSAQHQNDQVFSYLFDHSRKRDRVIAAYGFSGDRNSISRKEADKRLARHPRETFSPYDRGHMMSHLLGGGCDINLFPQHRTINRGAFQALEHAVLENAGSFYFVNLIYGEGDSQTPSQVEQAAVLNLGGGPRFEYQLHGN